MGEKAGYSKTDFKMLEMGFVAANISRQIAGGHADSTGKKAQAIQQEVGGEVSALLRIAFRTSRLLVAFRAENLHFIPCRSLGP
jgi:hypothetical protein